jgi:hypothetical protein
MVIHLVRHYSVSDGPLQEFRDAVVDDLTRQAIRPIANEHYTYTVESPAYLCPLCDSGMYAGIDETSDGMLRGDGTYRCDSCDIEFSSDDGTWFAWVHR